jgi:hypothetical protein
MHEFVREVVSPDAEMLAIDTHPVYQRSEGYPQHQMLNHQQGEYKRGDAYSNSIESIWALLKRKSSEPITGFPPSTLKNTCRK